MSDDYIIDPDEPPETASGRYWHEELDHAETVFKTYLDRADRVVARYRDERDGQSRVRAKFNILWSNVQVLSPSLYGRAAKPEVSRRYMDQDPIGRLASTMLERVLEYETRQFPDFDAAMSNSVEDRLLPGRGTVWLRYDPVITEAEAITNSEEPAERIDAAHSPVDYVYWKDFLHSPARNWDEVWWVARWVYMTREEGAARFGEIFLHVALSEDNSDDVSKERKPKPSRFMKKAKVAEIWNKRTGKVCWVAKGFPNALDERDDPLTLEGFFPCPRPLFATTTTGSLIPVPDYCLYQDQAEEMDALTQRIRMLVKAVKAVGVVNAEFKEVVRLLSEGVDNTLIPVTNWQALAEKNGLEGAVDMLDISTIIQALGVLYKAREDAKQTVYEICGISDILRGASDAQETLGAQQLKANFGSLRLKDSQTDVARFATDIFQIKAQIICKFYPPDLIIQMSGIRQSLANAPDEQQLLPQALQLLRDSTIRDFQIQVESDSLAQIDEQQEKQAASEAIAAISGLIQQASPMVASAPETLPMVSEMLLFLVRRYRAGRGLESAIERAMNAMQQKAAEQAQNPPPNPEEMKVKAQMAADQARVQADTQAAQMKAQFDSQVQQGKLQMEMQLEMQKAQLEERLAKLEGQIKLTQMRMNDETERYKAELDSQTRIQVAQIAAATSLEVADKNREAAEREPVMANG